MKTVSHIITTYICDKCGKAYNNEESCSLCEKSHQYSKFMLYLELKDLKWRVCSGLTVYMTEPEDEVQVFIADEVKVEDGLSIEFMLVTKNPKTAVKRLKEAAAKWLSERIVGLDKTDRRKHANDN